MGKPIFSRFALIYHLAKPSKKKSHFSSTDPLPPPRSDSLPKGEGGGGGGKIDEVDEGATKKREN